MWINKLDSSVIPHQPGDKSCVLGNKARCGLHTKKNAKSTFFSPTHLGNQQQLNETEITATNWPASTHIHGLEIRPTFDGNPLSWVGNSGSRGIGAMSLDYSCYYDSFDKSDTH